MSPPWILRSFANASPFFNSLSIRLRITNEFQLICNLWSYTLIPKIKSISQIIVNKVVTTKYLTKFQSPRAITQPKIIGPEWNVNLICNLSLYTHIPNIKSISQTIAKKKWWQLFYFGIKELGNTFCVSTGQKSPPLLLLFRHFNLILSTFDFLLRICYRSQPFIQLLYKL